MLSTTFYKTKTDVFERWKWCDYPISCEGTSRYRIIMVDWLGLKRTVLKPFFPSPVKNGTILEILDDVISSSNFVLSILDDFGRKNRCVWNIIQRRKECFIAKSADGVTFKWRFISSIIAAYCWGTNLFISFIARRKLEGYHGSCSSME